MTDSLTLEVNDLVVDVLTGIYSEETGKPQPLRISIAARYALADRYDPDTPLEASKNYMDLKFAASEGLPKGVHFKLIEPSASIDVLMVAPKGPGDLVRREYQRGRGVPSLFAIEQDATGKARDRAMGYAQGNGGATGGLLETTFREETETDLFGEQAVLCGGAKELVMSGFNTLVEAGYQPEIAYFECMHELKLIVDLFYEGGITRMNEFISETAKWGSVKSGPRVITDETRARMKTILDEIQSGQFAREWIEENEAGKPRYDAWVQADSEQPIEQTGAKLRERMAWLHAPQAPAEAA
jgi:ketol-acid reductoisomerase